MPGKKIKIIAIAIGAVLTVVAFGLYKQQTNSVMQATTFAVPTVEDKNAITQKQPQPLEGQGEYYDEHTGKRYKGFFKNGKLNGAGKVTEKDGTIREGLFVDSVQNDDNGKIIFASGKGVYTGLIKNDQPNGKGRLESAEFVYIGDFLNGEFNGNGEYKAKDGSVYKGDFINGKRHGEGRELLAEGKLAKVGIWERGNENSVKLEGIFAVEDFVVTGLQLGDSLETVEQKVGKLPIRLPSLSNRNKRWCYYKKGCLYFDSNNKLVINSCKEFVTARGIHQKSTLEDMKAAYGDNCVKTKELSGPDMYTYSFKAIGNKTYRLSFMTDWGQDKIAYVEASVTS